MSKIEVAASVEALNQAVAKQFVRLTTEAVRARGRCVVALAGGSTPKGVYRMLAYEPFRSRVQWDLIDFFWGDERHVAPDHADSNYRMADEAMLSKVPIAQGQIHRIRGEMPDVDLAAREYESEIRALSSDAVPRFDLVHLGLGTDGHTASLFPGTPALDEQQRLCVANPVAKLDTHRITLTLPVLNAARAVVFIVSGAGKAPIVREVVHGSDPSREFPAALVQPTDGELWWMLDRAAAGDQA